MYRREVKKILQVILQDSEFVICEPKITRKTERLGIDLLDHLFYRFLHVPDLFVERFGQLKLRGL